MKPFPLYSTIFNDAHLFHCTLGKLQSLLFARAHRQRADGDEEPEAGVETWALLVRFHALLPTADARWVGLEDIRAGDVDGEERRN